MIRIALAGLMIPLLGLGFYFFQKPDKISKNDKARAKPLVEVQPIASQPTEVEKPTEKIAQVPASAPAKVARFAGHFEMSVPVRQSAADQAAAKQIVGNAREERFWGIFREKDSALEKYVRARSIGCRGTVCTIEAESIDNDPDHFQTAIYDCLDEHPWVGNKIDVTTESENPLRATLVFYKEIPK